MLQDHFHPPLSIHRHWHAFHNAWATYIASDLNDRLPEGYFAEPNVQFGLEIEVATFEESPELADHSHETILAEPQWVVPTPAQTYPIESISEESVEISIFNQQGGPILAGAIELVSPANKDRPANRRTFVTKCERYLQQRLGLIIVDVVTERKANLHNELVANLVTSNVLPLNANLYTTAYRVLKHQQAFNLEIWQQPLEIGHSLPTMPLWLRDSICLPVDLGTTYQLTCKTQRIKNRE